MANNYKKIVLLKGLEVINDYHFRIVKSLLSNDLKLNPKMKEEYDKIQIADLMEEKFPGDAGLGKLIEFFKEIPTLGDLAETLKREKLKVANKIESIPVKGIIPSKKTKQKEVYPATPACTPSNRLTAKGAEETLGPQKRKKPSEEETGTKRSKMSKEQTRPSCSAGASTSTAMGRSPPPQTSSSAPPNTSSTEAYLMNLTLSLTAGSFLSCAVWGRDRELRNLELSATDSLSTAPIYYTPIPFAH
ncbi:pyrin and HIN domain family member 1 [Homo sapiens]|uniref:Isoform 5 of Pyrin and HIN domain-containing protein 1 n=1 Tax=Homo sapiens TaxID=9606 RepID=Q6K0P9-5|eukprot:XP_005244987.1 pyrin and HIN domain-containing protein 1 isoform X4 [Homo sapiens]